MAKKTYSAPKHDKITQQSTTSGPAPPAPPYFNEVTIPGPVDNLPDDIDLFNLDDVSRECMASVGIF